MNDISFTHLIFWQHPIGTLAFFALIAAFISFWVHRSAWLWGSFLIIACISAYNAGLITTLALIPIAALGFMQWMLVRNLQKTFRIILFLIASGISLALAMHMLPGFCNWQIQKNVVLSAGALPYNLWINFDKPFIGFFVLAFALPLIQSRSQLKATAKTAIPFSLLGILLLIFLSVYAGVVVWDPKIPTVYFVWAIINLFLVAIPEEAFFRGFLQRELYQWLGKNALAAIASILIVSLLFALFHLFWVKSLPYVAFVFITSVIYGSIYQYTKAIESSIFCHFLLNLVHFTFFTYPMLQK